MHRGLQAFSGYVGDGKRYRTVVKFVDIHDVAAGLPFPEAVFNRKLDPVDVLYKRREQMFKKHRRRLDTNGSGKPIRLLRHPVECRKGGPVTSSFRIWSAD